MKRRLIIFAIILAVGGLAWQILRPKPLKVEVAKVTTGDLVQTISASGAMAADEEAKVQFLTTGRVASIKVKEGDRVKKGDLLASLDRDSLTASLKAYKASLTKAEAARDQLYAEYKDLEDTDYRWAKKRQVVADVEYAQQNVRGAEESLSKADLYSPLEGLVTKVGVKVGENIAATAGSSFTITDPGTLLFKANIDETEIGQLQKGQKSEITLNAYPKEKFSAEIMTIAQAATLDASGNPVFETKFRVDFKGKNVLSGMKGDVSVVMMEKKNVLLVPYEAVIEEKENHFVWKVTGKQAFRTPVEIGEENDSSVEIVSGLQAGDLVIINPAKNLKDQALVTY